jgi:hypothetical protein
MIDSEIAAATADDGDDDDDDNGTLVGDMGALTLLLVNGNKSCRSIELI